MSEQSLQNKPRPSQNLIPGQNNTPQQPVKVRTRIPKEKNNEIYPFRKLTRDSIWKEYYGMIVGELLKKFFGEKCTESDQITFLKNQKEKKTGKGVEDALYLRICVIV